MDLVDRYLNAVGFWLPKDRKEDILKELAEDIRSEMEEKEAGLGRPLTQAEVEALLKRRGRPSLTASRFLPSRHLIGPSLFPMYVFALKIAGLIWFVAALILPLVFSLVLASRSSSFADALGESISSSWTLALTWFALITVGFAVAESVQDRPGSGLNWKPSRLPAVKNLRRVPRASSLAEVLFGVFIFSWWMGMFRVPGVTPEEIELLRLPESPLWLSLRGPFLLPIALLLLAGIVLAVISLVRPQLSRWRVSARAALDAVTAGLITAVLLTHKDEIHGALRGLKGLREAGEGMAKLHILRDWVLSNVLFVVALGSFISCIAGVVKLARWSRETGPCPH